MFCTSCGNQLADDSLFCTACGAQVCQTQPETEIDPAKTVININQAQPPVKIEQPKSVVERAQAEQVAQTPKTEVQPAAQQQAGAAERGKQLGKGPVIGAAAVAVIAVAVVVCGFFTGWFGLAGGAPVKSSLEAYSWAELSSISNEISRSGSQEAALKVAAKYNLVGADGKLDISKNKTVTLSNGTQARVAIAGFNHDDKSDGTGKAGITFVFVDSVAEHVINSTNSNDGGWAACSMRDWLNAELIGELPSDLSSCIVEVSKNTNNAGQASETAAVTSTNDKLWLLSVCELTGEASLDDYSAWQQATGNEVSKMQAEGLLTMESVLRVLSAEGKQYKLFEDAGVKLYQQNDALLRAFQPEATETEYLVSGENAIWWSRSTSSASKTNFFFVKKEGVIDATERASAIMGVAPGFCI